ncbi:hypothetical protein KEM55_004407 [Ascosphaera atra]|nr:hypothetical protein KEM55_004407 [Ascosphaera atra]
MSKNLLNSARKIRSRLQIALVRLDQTGDDANYRRLLFLDTTLERMIGRFEDEFPDTRLQEPSKVITYWGHGKDAHGAPATLENAPAASATEPAVVDDEDVQDPDPFAVRLSRSNSNTSLHSRWLTSEEGRVHRVSQHVRRDILGDSDGRAADSSPREGDGAEQDKQNMAVLALTPKDHQLRSIREKIKRLSSPSRPGSSRSASPFGSPRSSVGMLSPPLPPGAFPSGEPSQKQTSPLTNVPETMHSETSSESALSVAEADTDSRNADLDIQAMARSSDADDQALEDSLAELMGLKRNDPEGFERFKQSQIAAQINAGIREGNSSSTERGKDG